MKTTAMHLGVELDLFGEDLSAANAAPHEKEEAAVGSFPGAAMAGFINVVNSPVWAFDAESTPQLDPSGAAIDASGAPEGVGVKRADTASAVPPASIFGGGAKGQAKAALDAAPAIGVSGLLDVGSDWQELTAYDIIEHHHTCSCLACSQDRDEAEEANGGAIEGETTGTLGILQDMADYLLTGYWNTGYGDGTRSHNVTDSGIDPNNGVLHYNVSGYDSDLDGLTPERAELVREAFKLLEATLGIQFVETTSTDAGVVDFFFSDNSSGAYASHGYWNSGQWGSTITSTNINVAASWSGGTSTYDDYTLQTILHEIGHAMGLGHQGPYNGSATYGTSNVFDNDNWQASMMSYFSQTQATAVDASYEFLQTPMAVDWMALDTLYGRQGYGVSNAFTEDTTWGFNTTVTSDVSDIWATWSQWANRTASTIVDGGGIDTLDLSGYANNTLINLAPSDPGSTTPSTSDIGGRTGNLTIAAGTVIENAIGGAGSETFYGNGADNILIGNGGDDRFYDSIGNDSYDGGEGNDFVIFSLDFSSYTYTLVEGVLQVVDTSIDWIDSTIEWLTFQDQTLSWQAVADGTISNAAPTGTADSYAVAEDQLLAGAGLLDNDGDPDGDAISVARVEGVAVLAGGTTVTLASGAIVTMFADGTFQYDQNGAFDSLVPGEQGTDSFTYRVSDGISQSGDIDVTITIDGAFDNSGPVAVDDAFRVGEGDVLTGQVLTNDSDADGDALSVTQVNGSTVMVGVAQTLASGAVVTLNADGTFSYDTNGAFDALEDGQTDVDSFAYTISDGQGGFSTAEVLITIDGVSPPIVAETVLIDFEGEAPGAYTGDHGLQIDGLNVAVSNSLSGSRLATSGTNGDFIITSSGEDFDLNSLALVGLSGRQKVMFDAYDDGVLVGSFQANVSARKATNVTFDSTFDSVDQIVVSGSSEYLVDDISLVTRVPLDPDGNVAPIAVNDTLETGEAAPVAGNLLANDSDPNGDTLTLLAIEGDQSGTVTLGSGASVTFEANGDITYDPSGVYNGLYDGQSANDSFTYTVSDGQGGLSQATASVTINGAGTPPTVTTVDFEDATQTSADTVEDMGFVFAGAALTGADPGVTSGVQAIESLGSSVTVSKAGGEAFDFDLMMLTLSGRGKSSVEIEGYLDGVLVGSETLGLRAGRETAVNPDDTIFDRVDEVVVTSANGLVLDDLNFFG